MDPKEDKQHQKGVGIYDRPPLWRQPKVWVAAAAVAVAAGVTALTLLV